MIGNTFLHISMGVLNTSNADIIVVIVVFIVAAVATAAATAVGCATAATDPRSTLLASAPT